MKRTPLRRRTPLRQVSKKRAAEREDRDRVREAALRRAGYRCEAKELVPEVECDGMWWELEVDEIAGRGVRPGAHLELEDTQALCPAHHRWKTTHPDPARERGLTLKSWEAGDDPRSEALERQRAWQERR